MIKPYPVETEKQMRSFYESLSEKDKRRYAAIETLKLPYGGQSYIGKILGCDAKTIQQGLLDLKDENELKKKE